MENERLLEPAMIRTEDVRAFFDRCAPSWDAEMIRNDRVIAEILDCAEVREGSSVLDVACGTGVLFPDYIARRVRKVVGIDLSPEMIRIAREKFCDGEERGGTEISVLVGDVTETSFSDAFDTIVVYNAYPHFSNPDRLIESLTRCLKAGGRLTIAHGMSREKINEHHKGAAAFVSAGLETAEAVSARMARFFTIDTAVSDDEKFIVSGVRNEPINR